MSKFLSSFRPKINLWQLFFDFLVVFTGVTLAFFLSNYNESEKKKNNAIQVLNLMKLGVNTYEKIFSSIYDYHVKYNYTFLDDMDNGTPIELNNVTYPAPQYPVDVIKFIVTHESYDLLALQLYVKLTEFSTELQRLMYVEEKLVETAEQYTLFRHETNNALPSRLLLTHYRYLEIRKNKAKELNRMAIEIERIIDTIQIHHQ